MNHRLATAKPCAAGLLLAALSLVFGCTKAQTVGSTSTLEAMEAVRLGEREALPEAAREMLHARMVRHGDQLVDLMTSVLLLDYTTTADFADGIAREPKLGRPAPGEAGTLNALLPAAFFAHQDALAEHARALRDAARARDDVRLADAFAAVTKTCVGCHAAYLDEDFGFPLHDEPEERDDCGAGTELCPVRFVRPPVPPPTRRD